MGKKMNFCLNFHTLYKNKLKMDQRLKRKTIKAFEKTQGKNLQNLGLGKEVLDLTPKAKFMKGKIAKLGFMKMKTFFSVKRTNRQAIAWKRIFANCLSDKGLASRRYKGLKFQW